MILLNTKTQRDVLLEVAVRVRQRRLELNLTQEGIALRAGLKLPTYRKFEQTGHIAFEKLLCIAFALNCLEDFDTLFSQKKYASIEDVIHEEKTKERKRGKNL